MRAAYKALGHTIAGLVAVQAAVIAFAVMGLWSWVEDGNDLTSSAVKSEDIGSTGEVGFALHGIIGMMLIPLLAIALLAISFRVAVPAARTWAAYLLVAVVVQVVLGVAGEDLPALGLLHGLLALAIAWLGWHAAAVVGAEEPAVSVHG
jgi:hypothetical protein